LLPDADIRQAVDVAVNAIIFHRELYRHHLTPGSVYAADNNFAVRFISLLLLAFAGLAAQSKRTKFAISAGRISEGKLTPCSYFYP